MAARSACNTAMGERPGADTTDLSISWIFFHIQSIMLYYPAISANVQHSTWLGSARAASSGRNEARAERPGE